ncbi:MAG: outer membrane protein assembly factor BamD [Myxococcales bacterium]|nr:outer membrane protein assembly factor BamD [Myxococcales bacterium]USN49952.1 MAG: outer membrane protein assembly factor BamD [Myxococcales bacterium]
MFFFKLVTLSALLITINSCVTTQSLRKHEGSYLESVKLNFDAGEKALKDGEFEKAIGYFQFVRSKYPFSKFAALSDLRIADTKYAQKKWLDSASAYEIFVRLHPRHPEVPYATYRIGISYFYAVPTDFFLLPSSTTRDQTFTKEALSALDRFLLKFPNSEQAKDALDKRALLFSYLAKHSMNIADYYERRSLYQAAVQRFLNINNDFPNSDISAEALWRAANIFSYKIKDLNKAEEIYQQIVEQKNNSNFFEAAKEKLKEIKKKLNSVHDLTGGNKIS